MNFIARAAGISLQVALTALAAAPFAARTAAAQSEAPRVVTDPPRLEMKRVLAPAARLRSGPQAMAAPLEPSDDASLDLNIVYTKGKIWNPATQRYDDVNLRSYQGTRIDPNAPFISPMIEIVPSDTIRIDLHNKLPVDPTCVHDKKTINAPHCFNATNLHAHGLWVNPAGNGDNVLLSINPGVSFQYEYNVPFDHPAGTFWYHTHRHGSTALQVSSGMAGAIIIRGDRLPTAAATGDLDTLLKPTPAQPFKERVLVMQQIQYACMDAATKKVKLNPDGTYRCDVGDIGEVEDYNLLGFTWNKSGRYTSINGHVLPTFDNVGTGQIERWRVIHGGVHETINLEFRKLANAAPSPAGLSAADQDAFVGASCTGEPLPQHRVAADGLTTGAAIKATQTTFQPGYRWDLLMVFPEAGNYCVIDAAAPPAASLDEAAPSRQLLGMVKVTAGGPVPGDLTSYLATELSNAAAANMPPAVRSKVVNDLRNGLKLSSFVPHPDIQDNEVNPKQQTLVFNIDRTKTPVEFQVDGRPFNPNDPRVLTLGNVDQWELKSDRFGHPFHIHVNPFQVVKILDPSGKDVSGPDAVDDAGGQVDTQYRGLKGVWKDTLWVKNLGTGAPGRYTVVIRTRYQRYIGDYVLHCHILDHEDNGMMELVRMVLPDGPGGSSPHSH
jgi:FtsP/CotA-like multicopper oxidase with cupredoxin domain